jgi:glycosyltransferase involved in cell wall biosynthesis
MSDSVKVSVVIPCFNHGEFLPEAVASVTNISKKNIELIVVDDGSADQLTRKEVGALIEQGIHVIRQENRGLAAARNAGVLASNGEYILPLDADNRLRPGYVEHGIKILDGNPQVGIVYGDAEYIGLRTGPWHVGPFKRNQLLQWNYIDACAVYRRSIWEQNSGYDGAMPVQGLEDWDFWLGALEHGWQFAYVPEILFDYRIVKDSMITRTHGFEKQVEEFIALKHGRLYRDAWLLSEDERVQLTNRQESLKWTFRNLHRLFKSRFKHDLRANRSDGQNQASHAED